MADNIIKRVIQMVLDKASARKTQEDANQVAAGIDSAWKDMAKRVSGYLAVGFLVKKVIDFGKAAVEEATNADKAWKSLKNTIDNTGASYDKMQDHIVAAANAFQDATVHDDDAFAATLDRVVTLTGDVDASLNNMGLVANVAAKFFKGELEPAAVLVAKAMNGNTNALKKMGIQAKDAQEALEILAKRSMGAATEEAKTFGGQMKQLEEVYNDLLKETGNAIIANDGATNGVQVLRAAIQALTKWVHDNKDEIALWVTNGIKFAIDAVDVLARALLGMGNIIAGGFSASIGMAARIVGNLVLVLVSLEEFENRVRKRLGEDTTEREKNTAAVRANMEALVKWGQEAHDKAKDRVQLGVDILATPMFSSKDFEKGLKGMKVPELQVNRPMVGKNAKTDAGEAVSKALEQFAQDAKAAANMQKILGDQFDATGAEIERTTKLLNVLAANGVTPAAVGMENLSARLTELVKNLKPVQDALKEFHDEERVAENMHRVLGERFDATGAEIDRTTKLLDVLAKNGIDPATVGLGDINGRLTQLVTTIKPVEDATKSLAKSLKSNLTVSAIETGAAVKSLKKDQDEVLATMNRLRSEGMDPQAPRLQQLTQQYANLGLKINAINATATVDRLKKQQSEILATIKMLKDEGIDPSNESLVEWTRQYDQLTDEISHAEAFQNLTEVFKELGEEIRMSAFMASLEGADGLEKLKAEQQALATAIQKLAVRALKEEEAALEALKKKYKEVSKAIEEQTKLMQLQADVADVLAEALGFAITGGLHEAAVAKAKQNAIEAAEWLVRAAAFAIMGNPKAGAAFGIAAEFAAVAAMWGAFAAVTSGSGGGNASGASGGGAAGSDLTGSRASSNDASSKAEPPKPDVTINLIGPGFDAMNPKVQEIIWGAQQQAEERFGPNQRIRVVQKG